MKAVRAKILYLSVASLFIHGTPSVAADAFVEGSVDLGQGEWIAADVIAFQDDEEVKIVFTDKTFDREEMAADGRIDDFDVLRHLGDTVAISIGADGPGMCLQMQSRTDDGMISGSSCQSTVPSAITISSQTSSRISGSMDWTGDNGRSIALRFETAIYSEEELRRDATPLPPDGGEPGKAVLAHFEALLGGDFESLKSISHPEARAMMEQSETDGDHMEMLEFLQEISPRNLTVKGGVVMGDNAEIEFEAEEDGRPVRGTAEVVRHDGNWYFRGTTVRE